MTKPFHFELKPRYATREGDNIFVLACSRTTAILLLLAVVASVIGVIVTILSADTGVSDIAAAVVLLAGLPAVGWGTLESLWRVDERHGIIMAALLYRTAFLAPLVAVAVFCANTLLWFVEPLRERVETKSWDRSFVAGMIADNEFTMMHWFGMNFLMALIAYGIFALVLSVCVVLPVAAFAKPDQVIVDWYLSSAPEHRVKNTIAVRVTAVMLPLVFLGATLFATAEVMLKGTPAIVSFIGSIVALLSVAPLAVFLRRIQRADHEKLETSIWVWRRYNNPHDPPPRS